MVGDEVVTGPGPLGPLIHSFFLDHLLTVKGLRPASVRSYRDTIRLLLCFVAADKGTKITKLTLDDLSFERILGFLRDLEDDPSQPCPDPQPAAGDPTHAIRLHRHPRTSDARSLSAGDSHPNEASRSRRDPLPRTG